MRGKELAQLILVAIYALMVLWALPGTGLFIGYLPEPFHLAVLAWIIVWVWKFAELMRRPDNAFNGRWDKALWTVAFVIASPLAPLAFQLWELMNRETSE